VIAELERLAEMGFREVVLTGVHLGGYGADLQPRLSFADLVEMIAELSPVPRIRLSSIDPPEVTSRLLDIMKGSDVICPHLHVPVQSGADPVLRRMRRQYDASLVRDVAVELRRVMPDASLGTDLIAGFPGEAEADFEAGLALLEAAPFTYFHVFPYSRRSGTTAAKAKDPVPTATIRARASILRRLGERKRVEFAQRFVGQDLRVLTESKRDRETGLLVGYSRNYVRVLVRSDDDLVNRERLVRVVARQRDRVVAEPIAASNRDASFDN
jgi:threonylcarbamoyladenosine tRNA methylthiotransferase MtaB